MLACNRQLPSAKAAVYILDCVESIIPKLTYLIVAVVMLLAGCASWPQGADPRGVELQAQADMMVAAIVEYKNDSGQFPDSIEKLVPEYLSELPEVANFSFYDRDEQSLFFIYSPSWPQMGRTNCYTKIGSNKWGCHGYM